MLLVAEWLKNLQMDYIFPFSN